MNKTCKSNLNALKSNHLFLYERLTGEIESTPWFMPNETGYSIKNDNNEIIRGNPTGDLKVLENYKFHEDEASILFGIGDGKFLFDLLNKKHKLHIVILYESQLDIIQYAFEKYNFTKWLKDATLLIVNNKGNDELFSLTAVIDNANVIQDWVFFVEPYVFNKPSVYGEMFGKVQSYINHIRCNTGTVMAAGHQIAKNDIENLPYVIRHNGINVLKNAFENKPAILVSTGPSLQKNIHYLKEIQDKVIIIAVAQALRILQAYDIKPDFICTVDFGDVNITHFTGLMDSDVPLIALNRTYAPLLKEWKGTKFISSSINPGCEHTIIGILDDRGSLEQGGSVAHFALGIALHFNCNPIIMVGQDLALTDGLSHNPNADSAGVCKLDGNVIRWEVDDPRSETLNKDKHTMGEVVYVPGYFGSPVVTNIGLASFITAFEDIIRRVCKDKEIINATEGGARITGAHQMALIDVIEKYCKDNIDKKIIQEYAGLKKDYLDDIDKAIHIIEEDILILKDIIKESEQGLEFNKKLSDFADKKKKDKKEFNNLLLGNMEHSEKACKLSDKNPLVKLHIYHASRRIQARDLKVKGAAEHIFKHKDDLKIRIDRNKLILETAKKAAEDLIKSYEKTESVLKQYYETKDDSILISKTEYIPTLEDAEKYFNMGNWARPYTDALMLDDKKTIDKCIEMRNAKIAEQKELCKNNSLNIKFNELVYDAQKIGNKEKDFDKAFEMLDEAEKIYPDKFEVQWGRATALFHIGKFNEALSGYDKLIKEFPELDRIQFERCLVLMEIDTIKGVEEMMQFLLSHDSFQYFWRHIGSMYKNSEPEKALVAYKLYIEKFPDDFGVKEIIKELEEKHDTNK